MRVWPLLAVIVLAACAGRSGDVPGVFEQTVGIATETEIQDLVHRILALHSFEIEREVEAPAVYIETRWLQRPPYRDEHTLGIEAVQARVIVRGRPRSSTSTLGVTYNVSMRIEQRVRLSDSDEWVHLAATESARGYANEIYSDLKREFGIGVHRF